MTSEFEFGEKMWTHIRGDKDCGGCFGWPIEKPCECGGHIHTEWGDEDWDGYWLYYMCDQCGSTDNPE